MNSWKRNMALYVLLIASFVVFLPISANAYLVELSSYDSDLGSTGRIYGNDLNPKTPFPFVFCIEKPATVYVPGQYFAKNVSLSDAELKAAWLMKNFGNATYGGLDYVKTGIVVQNAIWAVTLQTPNIATEYLGFVNRLVTLAGSADLSDLRSSYARMDLFTDANFTNHVQDQIKTVPVPAAVWLLGSGLIGLIGIRRRFTS